MTNNGPQLSRILVSCCGFAVYLPRTNHPHIQTRHIDHGNSEVICRGSDIDSDETCTTDDNMVIPRLFSPFHKPCKYAFAYSKPAPEPTSAQVQPSTPIQNSLESPLSTRCPIRTQSPEDSFDMEELPNAQVPFWAPDPEIHIRAKRTRSKHQDKGVSYVGTHIQRKRSRKQEIPETPGA